MLTLVTHSLYPAYHNLNKITERILLACSCMANRSSTLHLGSVMATSMGPYISRLARYFNVSLSGCSKEGATQRFDEGTLHSMRLLYSFGPMRYIKGLSPDPEAPLAAEQTPARAPGRRRRPALPRPAQQPPPP
ncbi:unnamed protein product [Linum trigynum]|uniref:Uncharacterized protein n=1 Tax=Linum trigynum TaxID=586398 RepID=A0AAV2GDK6_9ROSI